MLPLLPDPSMYKTFVFSFAVASIAAGAGSESVHGHSPARRCPTLAQNVVAPGDQKPLRMISAQQKHAMRHWLIQGYRFGVRGIFFFPPPRVFVASPPKTGSHLLNQLLNHLPRMIFSGVHYSPDDFVYIPSPEAIRKSGGRKITDWQALGNEFARIRTGHYLTAHFPWRQELTDVLQELNYKSIFLIRDPRDTVVSEAFYVTRSETNYLHHRYNNVFTTTEERLMGRIQGFPPDEHGRGQQAVGARLAAYMPWLSAANTHVCRFESLVGAMGGGSHEGQRAEINSIAGHVNRPLSPQQVSALPEKIWSPRSSTFRKGQIGDWRNHFTEEHKQAFKQQAGQYLVQLGYEKDLNW